MAKVIATTHNADKTRNATSAIACRHNVAIGFGGAEFNVDGLVSGFSLCNEVGQGKVSIGSSHEVSPVFIEQFFLHTFCHTAEHTDNDSASFASHGCERFKAMNNFLLGIVAHGAGIEEYGISLVNGVARLIAGQFHHRGHYFAVGHIHLATVSFDI